MLRLKKYCLLMCFETFLAKIKKNKNTAIMLCCHRVVLEVEIASRVFVEEVGGDIETRREGSLPNICVAFNNGILSGWAWTVPIPSNAHTKSNAHTCLT